MLVEIENFGTRRQAGNVELSHEGRLIDVKPFDLAPGERRTDIYPALAANTGIANARGWLTAHLDLADKTADAFPLDDDAYAVVPPPRPVRVLLVTKGNWFLESLLRADDQITFDQLAPDAFQPAQAASFDVVVLDDFLPAGFDTPDALPAQEISCSCTVRPSPSPIPPRRNWNTRSSPISTPPARCCVWSTCATPPFCARNPGSYPHLYRPPGNGVGGTRPRCVRSTIRS